MRAFLVAQKCQMLWSTLTTCPKRPFTPPYPDKTTRTHTVVTNRSGPSLYFSQKADFKEEKKKIWQFHYRGWKCFMRIIVCESHQLSNFSKTQLNFFFKKNGLCWMQRVIFPCGRGPCWWFLMQSDCAGAGSDSQIDTLSLITRTLLCTTTCVLPMETGQEY